MRCPICKKPVDEAGPGKPAKYFPFCGERCRLIDLGRWLDGAYQIPAEAKDDFAPEAEDDRPAGAGD